MKYNCLIFYNLDNFDGKTIKEFFDFYNINKKKAIKLLNKSILVNDKIVKYDFTLNKKDIIKVNLEEFIDVEVSNTKASVVYEDDFVLIVNKKSGYLVHDDNATDKLVLSKDVAKYYHDTNQSHLIRPIHRLDEDTSGLVFFCKCSFFQAYFDKALQNKKISRKYLAIVFGNIKVNKSIVVSEPIGRNRHESNKMIISKSGKYAKTEFKVLKSSDQYSLIHCCLDTGRRHQIRIHLAHLGYPIVNDKLYGKKTSDFKKMGLYAFELEWIDPVTQEKKSVKSDLNNIEMF